MLFCLMMLTGIIEFHKCLKSLSGATAALNEKKKKMPVKKVVGEEITTHQNILQGAKCLKKKSIRPLVLSTRERNRQRFTPLI